MLHGSTNTPGRVGVDGARVGLPGAARAGAGVVLHGLVIRLLAAEVGLHGLDVARERGVIIQAGLRPSQSALGERSKPGPSRADAWMTGCVNCSEKLAAHYRSEYHSRGILAAADRLVARLVHYRQASSL